MCGWKKSGCVRVGDVSVSLVVTDVSITNRALGRGFKDVQENASADVEQKESSRVTMLHRKLSPPTAHYY